MEKRLYRSQSDRMLFGVCGGLGKYFGIDSTIIRIIAVLLAIASGVGIFVYIVMAFIIPLERTSKTTPRDVVVENAYEMRDTATGMGQEIRDAFVHRKAETEEAEKTLNRRRSILGILLIVLGVIILLAMLGVLRWLNWGVIGAIILIVVGVLIIISLRRK